MWNEPAEPLSRDPPPLSEPSRSSSLVLLAKKLPREGLNFSCGGADDRTGFGGALLENIPVNDARRVCATGTTAGTGSAASAAVPGRAVMEKFARSFPATLGVCETAPPPEKKSGRFGSASLMFSGICGGGGKGRREKEGRKEGRPTREQPERTHEGLHCMHTNACTLMHLWRHANTMYNNNIHTYTVTHGPPKTSTGRRRWRPHRVRRSAGGTLGTR
jgi:hypothetical protein